MNQPTKLPQRLTERAFRRYESVLAIVIRNYPEAVDLTSYIQGSALTFSARLRDAKASYSQFNWPSTIIDRNKFEQIEDDVIVRHSPDKVVAGSRHATQAAVKPIQVDTHNVVLLEDDEVPTSILFSITYELATFLCHLAAQKCLSRPILVEGLNDAEAASLEENYDVSVVRKTETTFTII